MILVYDTVLCDTVFCDTVLCDTCMWYFYVILYFRGYLSLWASSGINDVTTLNRFLMMIGWLCFCLYFQFYFCFEKKSILFCLKLSWLLFRELGTAITREFYRNMQPLYTNAVSANNQQDVVISTIWLNSRNMIAEIEFVYIRVLIASHGFMYIIKIVFKLRDSDK